MKVDSPQYDSNAGVRWYVVSLLLIAYAVSFLDRILISLMVIPIQTDLDLSYTEISLLQGLAFSVFYSLLGLPIGRLVDRYNRRNIIVVGIVLWSLATAASGLARSYVHLFLARMGVAVGEATLSPSAYSIISDYFPASMLARATSIYSLGTAIGSGMAFILGGALIDTVSQVDEIILPLLGEIRPWQLAFFIAGVPGLLLAIPLLTVREPARREFFQSARAGGTVANEVLPLRQVLKFITTRWRAYGAHFLGFSLLTLATYAVISWIPTHFIQAFGWSVGDIGLAYGLIYLVFGSAGLFFGGVFADRLLGKGYQDGGLRVAAICSLCLIPIGIATPLVDDATTAVIMLAPLTFLLSMPFGLAPAVIMLITPNRMRGQISAIYLFCINIVGLSLGPFSVAFLVDFVFGDQSKLGLSMAIVTGVAATIAAIVLASGCSHFRKFAQEHSSAAV